MAIDTTLLEEEARFLMGGLSVDIFSSTLMQMVIAKGIAAYSDSDDDYCNVLYYTIIETLRYLNRQSMVTASSTGASGAVKKHQEKEGDVEITTEYDTSSDTTIASYDDLLEEFLNHPEYVCDELVVDTNGTVFIGGTSIEEAERVNSDIDSRNGITTGVSSYEKIFKSPMSNYFGYRSNKWFN